MWRSHCVIRRQVSERARLGTLSIVISVPASAARLVLCHCWETGKSSASSSLVRLLASCQDDVDDGPTSGVAGMGCLGDGDR